eukprot:TRINITY_DN54534_c0_g1_i1.p1 TRINITY_DN54534_c0_g1~~TRINITY_DN54534_c0_g1_i1.p1  ORF type:complete len:290 (-),score=30.99 TRINITY_DN54534_c0_g1_i1:127-876(-)
MDAFDVDSSFHNMDTHPLCPVCLDCVKAYTTDLWKKHVIFFEGNSLKLANQVQKMVSQLRQEGNVGPVIVSLDAQHSFDATLVELHLYGDLVHPGSYLILQDVRLDMAYGRPGPFTAGVRLLEEEPPQWVWDRDVEIYGHTQHMWLRRIAFGPPVGLSFNVIDEDLVSSSPFRLKIRGSICWGGAPAIQEIDWSGSDLACQAICLRVADDVCRYIAYHEKLDLCVLHGDCPQLVPQPESEPVVYERIDV